METFFVPVDREMEIPEENAPTTDVLPEEDVVTVASPSTLVVSGAEPSLRVEGVRAAEALLIEDGARVPGSVGPSGTTTQSPVLILRRLASSFLFGLFL